MSRKGLTICMVALLAGLVASPAVAKGPSGPSGKSPVGHLYLVEKDPDTWDVVDGGAWGKMWYSLWGPEFRYVFNGHHLVPGKDYTLLYYPDPWPGEGLICLGTEAADEDGDIHIKNTAGLDIGSLPAPYDENEGAKIWLVSAADADCEAATMTGWNPAEYLFEWQLIRYIDTDE